MSPTLKQFGIIFFFCILSFQQAGARPEDVQVYRFPTLGSALFGQDLDAIRKRGFSSLRSGDWESARTDFVSALEIAPDDALALYGLALALFNLKEFNAAAVPVNRSIEILSKLKNTEKSIADSLVLSALISAVQNDNTSAVASLEKAVRLAPEHFDANLAVGRAYFGRGDIDKSAEAFKRAVALQPNDVRARFYFATVLERLGNSQDALFEYWTILKLQPDSADGNLGLGVLLIKTEGDSSKDGLAALEKAVALNGELYEARITLGKTLIRRDRAADALVHLQKASQLAPKNPEPHFQLAIAFRKLGRKSEADAQTEIVRRIHEARRKVSDSKQQ